ncbi:MAG: GtrA family protein [Gammaproteobacteria bacterium AqS3]|nr:GtrA family protein [Gammaproteobacteria bacterium AqS3]
MTTLAVKYSLFCLLAVLANLATQRAVLFYIPDRPGFIAALICGTAAGLILKFVLDKWWIFSDRELTLRGNSRKFLLYSAMGIPPTLLFWLTESLFWSIWGTHVMREMGAVLGLAAGYVTKYFLDKHYVFTTRAVQ